MTTKSICVERNYRISNDDIYMKARLSQDVVPDENESMETATLRAIQQLDNVFRIAYPHVAEHINFHKTIQVNPEYAHLLKQDLQNIEVKTGQRFTNAETVLQNTAHNQFIQTLNPTEKIQKGTIEEQIEACTEIEGKEDYQLESFKLFASTNKKYKEVYNKKLSELMGKKSKLQTT